jgi:hypothetical protein
MEDDFAPVVKTEADDVAIAQIAPVDFFTIHEDSLAMAQVLDFVARLEGDNSSAAARDAPVVELEVVSGFAAPADEERRLGYGDKLTGSARKGDFQNGFTIGELVRHRGQGKKCTKRTRGAGILACGAFARFRATFAGQ